MAAQRSLAATGRTDGRDWLVEATEPLAGLQLRNGGELPGLIVTPALLELVRKARAYRFKLARIVQAQDGGDRISAWIAVQPDEDGSGCTLSVASWHSEPLPEPRGQAERERQLALYRQLAELTARLGPQLQVLTAEGRGADVQQLLERMQHNIGSTWTDFVELEADGHTHPLHWRLLDGVALRIAGSQRGWRAHLEPLGKPADGKAGYALYLVPDTPLPDTPAAVNDAVRKGDVVGIGLEIAPVLRQPVSRIIANAETIRSQLAGPLAEEYSNYAADIASAGDHLLALIDDLTTLEMVEDEDFDPAPDHIDLADVARRAAGILGVRARERGLSIDAPKADEAAPAIGEFRRVLQVLLNLIGNAIRYSPEGGDIWVRVEQDSGRSRVVVADQGEGLDEEEQGRVFAKFERLGRKDAGGSGLGLYISRRLAHAMDGTLTVESAKGQGARFILDLPADSEAGG